MPELNPSERPHQPQNPRVYPGVAAVRGALEPDTPLESPELLAPMARSMLAELGSEASNPEAIRSYIRGSVVTETTKPEPAQSGQEDTQQPTRIPLLPEEMVKSRLEKDVPSPDRVRSFDRVQLDQLADQRNKFVKKAVLHHPLPEVSKAIHLHAQLKALGKTDEAEGVLSVLHAIGMVLETLPKDSGIFYWVDRQLTLRQRAARGI
jgi:hypothetical protein